MVKEAWSSLKDNIKDRITNPFLGTFVVVWIAHNWQVVYSFFYFDNSWKLESKIKYFKDYWIDKSFFWNLMYVAATTLGILIITYLFLAIARYLAKIFENIIIPFINKISKGKIVTGEIHQIALDRISSLEAKVEEERKLKNEAINERDEFEKRLYADKSSQEDSDNVSIEADYAELIKTGNSTFNKNEFEKTLLDISKEKYFDSNNRIIDFLLKYGLIVLKGTSMSGYSYNFTDIGSKFRRQYFK